MESKNTDALQQELMQANNLDRFLTENDSSFRSESAPEMLKRLFEKRNITKAALAKQSGMSEVYLHQVFSGRRNPSRNRLLCLCFGLQATFEETQNLLLQCRLAPLYPRDKRDAIIIFCLSHDMTLFQTNDKLFAEREETLC
ncbi:MAG: helix-turn-helix transcriptional regulator [Oscillospiraceae bacterium]|nr:helix-turn-helix transcriptional regulator [Oscillospiraceae bacterium]MBR0211442.1 helix-turn-helix transcriptional regulator [Oscillospiraceae bacterium]